MVGHAIKTESTANPTPTYTTAQCTSKSISRKSSLLHVKVRSLANSDETPRKGGQCPRSSFSTNVTNTTFTPPVSAGTTGKLERSEAHRPSHDTGMGIQKLITSRSRLTELTPETEAKPHLEGLPPELILVIVRKLRLSDLITLSLASQRIRDIIAAPVAGMLSTQSVIYWYWGPEDRRLPFAETERNTVRFAPLRRELKSILDHLCMRHRLCGCMTVFADRKNIRDPRANI